LAINKGNGYDYAANEYTSAVSFNLDTTQIDKIYHFGDFNGDGRQELFYKYASISKLYNFATGTPSNLLKTIINGHGAKTAVNYLPMTNTAVYTKGSGAGYPIVDIGSSAQLVSSVVADNGTATATTMNYSYNGAKAHIHGKGFLGFTKTTAVNGASGVTTESNLTFETTNFYPQISTVVNKKGGTLLSTDSYLWDKKTISGKRVFPFIKKHTQVNNLTNQTVITDYTYFDAYGNIEKIKTDYGGGHTKELVYKYENELPSPSYLVGRPTTVDENYARDAVTSSKKVVRVFKTTSNAVETEKYNEGSLEAWTLTREYDNWGNVKKESRSATGIATLVTEFNYDALGVNLGKVKDVNLAYETNYTYYPANGLLYEKTDPFGNKITYAYDNSDQLYTLTPTTGVTKTIARSYNITGGPSLARFYVSETGNDGTAVKTWYDKTGKEIRNETKGFGGSMVKTDKVYLSSGLLQKYSEPTTGTPTNWNTYAYSATDNRLSTFTPKYGPVASYTYPNSDVIKTVNSREYKTKYNNDGTVLQNQDPGGTLSFAYWPEGTVKSTTTPEGMITSMVYDKNGNRLTMDDPSAGTITNQWYGTGQAKILVVGGKLTTYYYQANGLLDYEVADGQTTDYSYNIKNQLSNISSPGGVSRSYTYYSNGAVQTITESIGGVSNTVAIEYDSYGRLFKKTFNWADYEQHDYQNGYLYKIIFNGSTVWQATTIDEYSRIRAANIGATAATWTYSPTTNLLSQIKGTGVQQYDYDFSGTTGNLSTRTNGGKSETFGYDTENLDRLVSVNGVCPQTLTYQPANKGNILTKSDAGTYVYDPTRKYALTGITNGQNISTTSQQVTYNVFNKVQTITEGTKTADFVYNADHQRIRMTLKTSGTTTKTRWYFGGSCEREVVGSTTTQYIWIGGDAYTAVAVAKKVGTGSWTVYNIFRDHLGTITHLKNGTNPADEYTFDAWGRRRDKDTWSYTLSGEPALFADRGFTSHEFLADFNLYNMNGRLYDPVVGRFLSPDPFIQDPSFSQSYNRYSYCLNNPLVYTDPTGEKWRWGNPFYHFDRLATKFMDWVNRKAEPVNDFLVKHNAPAFGGGYNSTYGAGFYVGNNPMYYPGYEKRIATGQGEISNQIAGFSGMGANTGSPVFGNGDVINQQISEEDYFQIYGELSISIGPQLGFELSLGAPILAGFLQGPSMEVKYKPYLRFSERNGWSAGIDVEKNNINYKKGYSYPLKSYEKYDTYGVYEHPAFSKSTVEIQRGVVQTKNVNGVQNSYFRTHWGPYVRPLIFGVGVDFGFEGPFDY
jgi:RHS repeat-associated protein